MLKATPINDGHHTLLTDGVGGCTDQVVGDILSGWRYDISSLSEEMRTDYVMHLEECAHCRGRQRMHRTIDVALMVISSLSIVAFLFATAYIHQTAFGQMRVADVHLRHLSVVVNLQMAAAAGLLFSLVMWVLVAIATPAPKVITHSVRNRRDPRDL